MQFHKCTLIIVLRGKAAPDQTKPAAGIREQMTKNTRSFYIFRAYLGISRSHHDILYKVKYSDRMWMCGMGAKAVNCVIVNSLTFPFSFSISLQIWSGLFFRTYYAIYLYVYLVDSLTLFLILTKNVVKAVCLPREFT